MFEAYKNPGQKTYNGAALLADLSGVPIDEIRRSVTRIKELLREGKTARQAAAIVRAEAANA